jgi:ABC-type transport system involved in multi-copper enzyme maturation permease subunit
MRIFRSGIRKLVRRPATYLTFGLLAGLLTLIILGVATSVGEEGPDPEVQLLLTFPAAYGLILQFVIGLGGLFAVIFGANVAGSEWGWGTFKVAVARGESRSRYLLLTFASVAAVLIIAILVPFGVGVVAAFIGANIAGIPTDGMTDAETLRGLPEQFARGWYAMAEQGAIGFAVATLARSQLAGIGIGIAFFFGETFAGIFLPEIVRYMPFNVASAAVGATGGFNGEGGPEPLAQGVAMVLVAAWLFGSLLVAAVYGERAEITG